MLPYWLLFSYFVVGTLFQRALPKHGSQPPAIGGSRRDEFPGPPAAAFPPTRVQSRSQVPRRPMFALGALIVALMVGLRFEVGGDWSSYEYQFALAGRYSLESFVPKFGDAGYNLISWTVRHTGGEIWLVNLVAGSIFAWGLYRFAKVQSEPWLTMVVAVPYLIIVVAMGYTRQSMAIGILLAGLAAVHHGASTLRFGLYCAAAALFHKTAIVIFPLVALASSRTRFVNLLITLSVGFIFYDLFLASSVATFRQQYLETLYASEGATIRILLCIVPAVIFFGFGRRFGFSAVERKLWLYFSLAVCALGVALIFSPSSTAVDRVALYFIPLQLAILPRIPETFKAYGVGKVVIVGYSAAILAVWLNFAKHAEFWIPYRMYLGS